MIVKWNMALCDTLLQVVRVHGQCASPAIARGEELSRGRKYHVCRHRGNEHCSDVTVMSR